MTDDTQKIVADNFRDLEGQARYELGRGVFLSPTSVVVGVSTPRDVRGEPGDTDLKFDNTELVEVDVSLEDGKLVAEIPGRDALYEIYEDKKDEHRLANAEPAQQPEETPDEVLDKEHENTQDGGSR
jgi:hypothetical protein